jgi:hypothetical protein
MKARTLMVTLLPLLFLFLFTITTFSKPRAGFYMPDSLQEVSFRYRNFDNLIILPVVINDSVRLNLILDTGCRNLVLFGRSFQKYFSIDPARKVRFSGLGEGKALYGGVALDNKISIGPLTGEGIPVVVVSDRGIFKTINSIDGVIGYDIFIKFEIELNPSENRITFRPAMTSCAPEDYTRIPLRIEDSLPILTSSVLFNAIGKPYDLMIDTGSSLGLLLKTTDLKKFTTYTTNKLIGRGLNGNIQGYEIPATTVVLSGFDVRNAPTHVTASWHNHASIGMAALKDYSIIFNYVKEYVCLKKV